MIYGISNKIELRKIQKELERIYGNISNSFIRLIRLKKRFKTKSSRSTIVSLNDRIVKILHSISDINDTISNYLKE